MDAGVAVALCLGLGVCVPHSALVGQHAFVCKCAAAGHTQRHQALNEVIATPFDYLYFANQEAADNIHTQIKADRTQTQT